MQGPLVQLLNVDAAQGGRTVLRSLNFELRAGQSWLIGGGNGAGKSSFFKLLRGDLTPTAGERRYGLDGRMWRSAVRAKRAFALVGPEQEAFYLTRDWVQTARDLLLAGHEGLDPRLWAPEAAALARLDEVAGLLSLTPLLDRDVRTLSHGQRRRALLGRALMTGPQALLLDEFSDGLDAGARAELGAAVTALARSGVAVLLASHRPEEAPELEWQVAHLVDGRLVDGPAKPFANPERPTVNPRPAPGEVLVQVERASLYRNGTPVLHDLSWTWQAGQHWAVTGANGAGKSSFARLLAGELHPALGGSVRRPFLNGPDTLARRHADIGLVSAEAQIAQRRGWTGQQVLASGFAGSVGRADPLSAAQADRVAELADLLDLQDLLERPATTLSQGQLKRLLIGRALVGRPQLLLLDEPFDFLDATSRARVQAALADALAGGAHLLVIAHRPDDLPAPISHHLQLAHGRVLALRAISAPTQERTF